ncbi:hypothetical protein LTR96_006434 [Exophiala xenobiotica]|uniref:Uncharacterized protein n=1 Tax=Vermiconidia calcicola TaxID=1690605 RepID=A0AAV9PXS9_9PEZI|nr:hypothetical protein LTR96_006434 [Exophiala xenobiotica]KAK5336920.1 hypothetical protein LTR98_007227 [Exophiala xenobiotica]KAK5444788.1 hypothetical protein LTR18_004493 [Exophiala xenobiotica]KAK5529819.1 hypothetical protein LTR25_009599 [Vermiconidia calcicola]KAK5551080.1 hypothetical protein LTR46_010898 [Exophiala xenobiotica]
MGEKMGEINMSPGDKLIIGRGPNGNPELRHVAYEYESAGSTSANANANADADADAQQRGDSEHPSKLIKLEDGQGRAPRRVDAYTSSQDGQEKKKDGPRPKEAGVNKLTIIASKELEHIRAGMVGSANENVQLRHQLAMLEKKLADAEYHARLYWECGIEWARQELQWMEEREGLRARVRVLQQRMLAEKSVHKGGGTAGRSESAGSVVAGKMESAGDGGDVCGNERHFFQPAARHAGMVVENGQNVPDPGLGDGLAASRREEKVEMDMVSSIATQCEAVAGNVTATATSPGNSSPASKTKETVQMLSKASPSDAVAGNVTETNAGTARF